MDGSRIIYWETYKISLPGLPHRVYEDRDIIFVAAKVQKSVLLSEKFGTYTIFSGTNAPTDDGFTEKFIEVMRDILEKNSLIWIILDEELKLRPIFKLTGVQFSTFEVKNKCFLERRLLGKYYVEELLQKIHLTFCE